VGLARCGSGGKGERWQLRSVGNWGLMAIVAVAMVASQGWAQSDPAKGKEVEAARKPLTKDQAKELFRSVDDILAFVSADTKLPIAHSVKRKLMTREAVNKYLREKFDEDEGAKRLARSEIVLKKFGLLDRDFQLQPFMISLLTEQVAGFYDNKTKTVNLLDWIEPDDQKPVLAHELTHALQDQWIDLTKWSEVGAKDIAKNVEEDNQHIQTDEADTARDAVAEGQAMVVYLDYGMRSTGKTLENAPNVMDRIKDTVSDTSGSPILARAPLLLQRSLLFPYSEGLAFEDAILVKGGKEAAFADVLVNPPSSSSEIMHPAAYMAHVPVPVLRLPDIHPLIEADYAPYDVGVMGEFDVRILTELFGGPQVAEALTSQWNGGIYYAVQRKSAVTAEEKGKTSSIALLYESKWKNDDSARTFLRVYAGELPRKYSGVSRRKRDETDEGEEIYSTNEGDVLLSISGTSVFVSEGFALPLARKLRDSIVDVQSSGPLQVAGVASRPPAGDPGMEMVRLLSSAGMVKAAIGSQAGRYTLGQQ
jgi:hypothetical protein